MFKILKKLFFKENIPISNFAIQHIKTLYELTCSEELNVYIGSDLNPFINSLGRKIYILRNRLFNQTGLILPPVKIEINNNIQENEYQIFVRNYRVYQGFAVFSQDFAPDEICQSLENICFQYIDDILSVYVTEKYLDFAQEKCQRLVKELLSVCHILLLRNILISLLKNKQSIKNICLIFEKVCEYFHKEKNPIHDPELIAEFVKHNLTLI